MNEEQAYQKLSALCARAEHCEFEMTEKMRRWLLPEEAQAAVMRRLTEGRFVDNERYARAFVADKIKNNKWGRRKIEQALFMKRIDKNVINAALDDIPDEMYVSVLRPLLAAKRRTTKAASDYELRGKLIRFALSRGFTMDVIEAVI